ncbi:DUF4097 family beta strand repeat-containing protein [Idiomarina seosinensis]|uniref:DUF4097 domain-containing protein n=1 Tax=Idiomarina seosinensis TaxID=281739 RepID=A0A432Z4H0_9GAMM|nr:DUF4097 family beta strand repeat-containing protein [Idiomarina seosinensis]RUO72808.1 hypothetical protein CWI81_12570 [Idiomarina seosinensis]
MRILTLLAGLVLTMTSFYSLAQESVDKTLDVTAGTRVYLNNERGNLEVITHKKDQVRLVGTLDEKAEDLVFEVRSNGVRIDVRTPEQKGWGSDNSSGSDLTLYMPESSLLKVDSVSMNINASNLMGGIDVTSVSGDINLAGAEQQILLKTVSGNIATSELAGDVTIETVSGDIEDFDNKSPEGKYQAVSGDVTIRSSKLRVFELQNVSGKVSLELPVVDRVLLKNVSGDVEVLMGLSENARVEASSVSGDLNIRLNDQINASFAVNSSAGGDIINGLTDAVAEQSRWGASASLEFPVGTGAAEVKLRTVSGTVEIKQD